MFVYHGRPGENGDLVDFFLLTGSAITKENVVLSCYCNITCLYGILG